MRSPRVAVAAFLGIVLGASSLRAQGGGTMGHGGMVGRADSTSSAIMSVVHELMMNHDKLRRTVTNLPDGVRTLTESDDPVMAEQLRKHVAATGTIVANGQDLNLPMTTAALHGVLRNGTKVVRHTEPTEKGILVTETSADSATVALLQAHAAEVTDLVNRGMAAMQEMMMRGRGAASGDMSASSATPTRAGQEAFATIAEIVRLLDGDPRTDWSKVDLEALRQHLIDMDDVTMRAEVRSTNVTGGAVFDLQGTGRVREAIRRMATSHGATIVPADGFSWQAVETSTGARVTVLALNPNDARAVTRIRALGFVALLTLGDHHTAHHLGIADGSMRGSHRH